MHRITFNGTIVLILMAMGAFFGCDKPIDADSPVAANSTASGGTLDRTSPAATTCRGTISVMTQNMYVGTNDDSVLSAILNSDPSDDLPALEYGAQVLQLTDFPARAKAMAGEIARARPHAVGLQEVSMIDADLTGLGIPFTYHVDFLPTIMADLAKRGLHYVVAATVNDIDVTPVEGVHLADRDALLVDADRVKITSSGGQNYSNNLGDIAPGIVLKRGWVWAHVVIGGAPYVFASTHLEGSAPPNIRGPLLSAQIGELVQSLSTETPVIVMGDLNDHPGSPMYETITGAGFTDAWAALWPGTRGYTCCFSADLSDKFAHFTERIDYVFVRGFGRPLFMRWIGYPKAGLQGQISMVGDEPWDRVPGPAYPIWPSDHAGLVLNVFTSPSNSLSAASQ
jgi:endonuclease/exonuclease/phosphatase family metal-dependent hydrolase